LPHDFGGLDDADEASAAPRKLSARYDVSCGRLLAQLIGRSYSANRVVCFQFVVDLLNTRLCWTMFKKFSDPFGDLFLVILRKMRGVMRYCNEVEYFIECPAASFVREPCNRSYT
jgi:hypothetical protein